MYVYFFSEFFLNDWSKGALEKCVLSTVFSRLKILQGHKKLRMWFSSKIKRLRSCNGEVHVIHRMFSSCRRGKMPLAGLCLTDSVSLLQRLWARKLSRWAVSHRIALEFGQLLNLVSCCQDGPLTWLTTMWMSFFAASFFLQTLFRPCYGNGSCPNRFALISWTPFFFFHTLPHTSTLDFSCISYFLVLLRHFVLTNCPNLLALKFHTLRLASGPLFYPWLWIF